MTSILAAAAPLLLALVPCLFSHSNPSKVELMNTEPRQSRSPADDRDAWWKPNTLGIDNYS